MKSSRKSKNQMSLAGMPRLVAAAVAGIVLVAFTPAVSAQAYKKGQKASESLAEFASKVQEGKTQIGTVMSNLNVLVTNPGQDLRKPFAAFDKSVKKLVSAAETAKKRRLAMQSRKEDFFKLWDEEIAKVKSEDIRNRSTQRKQQVQGEFEKIAASAGDVGTAYKAFESDIVDIQKYLGTDLTRAGIEAIGPVAKSAAENAEKIQKALAETETKLQALGVAMSANAPAPTK